MNKHTVSVIIPTNRGGRYLRDAVASVREQTVPVAEVILVDDGSPPHAGLEEMARELGIQYVRQSASGVSNARNTGVSHATGAWVAFLDDDDVWHPERIECQLRALEAEPEAIASHTGGWYMDREGRPFGTGWPAPAAPSADMISYRVVPPRITTMLINRKVLLQVGGFAPEFALSEDNDLILRLLQQGRSAAVDRQLVGYRRHAGNVTNRGLAGREASRISILRQLRAARSRGDQHMERLLRDRMRAHRRIAAKENLGDLLDAVRRRDWRYGGRTAWWGVWRLPAHSFAAVWARTGRAVRRRSER